MGNDNIILDDLLQLDDEESVNIKIKFNQHNGNDNPLDLYLKDPDMINNQWLFWRN